MMCGMDQSGHSDGAGPAAVRLHLHRGVGWGLYGTATAVMLPVGVLLTALYLRAGRWWMAGLCAVVGLGLTLFLAGLTFAMVRPALTVTAGGIGGRTPRGSTVEAHWDEVTIDVDEDAFPGTIRLDIGEESMSLHERAWIGFMDFVGLVSSTPHAAARMTPAAREEVVRLLRIGR
jgi:hypothetical protein